MTTTKPAKAPATKAPAKVPVTKAPVKAPATKKAPSNGNILKNILWILLAILILIGIVIGVKALLNNTAQQQALQTQQQQALQTQNKPTWSIYGQPSFIVNDGTFSKAGSDLFTDPSKGSLALEIKPSEPTCLLQFGVTEVYTSPFSATFVEGDSGAGFRVIAKTHWSQLPESDGAFSLCWDRR